MLDTPPPAPAPYPTCLVVDDDDLCRLVTARRIERMGFRIVEHSDGRSALDWIRSAPLRIDLLVTDFHMPGLDGGALARAVRSLRPEIPVVVISGDMPRTLRRQLAPFVHTVLEKPALSSELLTAVLSATGRL